MIQEMLEANKESRSLIQTAIGQDSKRLRILQQNGNIRPTGAIWPNLHHTNAICLCIEKGEISSAEILIEHLMKHLDNSMSRKVLCQVFAMAFDGRYSDSIPKRCLLEPGSGNLLGFEQPLPEKMAAKLPQKSLTPLQVESFKITDSMENIEFRVDVRSHHLEHQSTNVEEHHCRLHNGTHSGDQYHVEYSFLDFRQIWLHLKLCSPKRSAPSDYDISVFLLWCVQETELGFIGHAIQG